jgi:hypothetical protein
MTNEDKGRINKVSYPVDFACHCKWVEQIMVKGKPLNKAHLLLPQRHTEATLLTARPVASGDYLEGSAVLVDFSSKTWLTKVTNLLINGAGAEGKKEPVDDTLYGYGDAGSWYGEDSASWYG